MKALYQTYLQKARQKSKETRSFLKKLRKKVPKNLDQQFQEAHEKAFEEIDCLQCANCCKTMSPRVKERDIKRISKLFNMSKEKFFARYLEKDDDGDYIMNQTPCPFLQTADNKCMIYEDRPEACANFPHTNHGKMHKHLNIAAKNYERCPIVYKVLEGVKRRNF